MFIVLVSLTLGTNKVRHPRTMLFHKKNLIKSIKNLIKDKKYAKRALTEGVKADIILRHLRGGL
ncbi:hypothetical protein IBJ83_00010 [Parvimonas sp. S3374]|uniref:Uncharacterized protein n=1 Tax=Parvimonas parva TaxID=2769485 RepID=A0ABS1C6I5_9FIRM|nr:hypothetical protein [Parvimonas parva]